MHVIILIMLAMAVGLGALFLLAKAEKENLGKLYSTSGYVVLTISALIIVFAISLGIMKCCKQHGGCCDKNKTEQGCEKEKCSKMKGHCKMGGSSCSGSASHCEMGDGSCSKGEMKCGKGGCDMMMKHHGGKMFEKKMIHKMDGDTANVEVKVITD